MKTLRIGIASAAEYKARTMAIARGELNPSSKSPKVSFASIESEAKDLSDRNGELYGIVRFEKRANRKLAPRVTVDEIQLDLRLRA